MIVYMFKNKDDYGGIRILVVYQNRHPKQYYIDMGWDEEEIEKIKLSKEKLNNLW